MVKLPITGYISEIRGSNPKNKIKLKIVLSILCKLGLFSFPPISLSRLDIGPHLEVKWELGVVVDICNPKTREAEAGQSLQA